jgi:S-adenosylmethionine:tRNA ribosyltransferase-isomerase
MARAYRRHAALARVEESKSASGASVSSTSLVAGSQFDFRTDRTEPDVLRTDEVSRHAVHLVVIDSDAPHIVPFATFADYLRAGDLVVVNDAATLPASLRGTTSRGEPLELRLSAPIDGNRLIGVLFGRGDHHTRTEHRELPPAMVVGEHVSIANITARVEAINGRRVELLAEVSADALWQAIYAAGAPIQYAHRPELLPLYAVQTAYAARPWAVEMPSAGRPLTWDVLLELRRRGVAIATLTHAAGLSSTGDATLDAALPWPEHYESPERTARVIVETKQRGGRVIAIGTTVVRALEAAGGRAGQGVATLRLDARYRLRVVDGIVSGLHAPGESHFELLSAFVRRERLVRAIELAARAGLSSHELGDVCLVTRDSP